MSQQNGITQVQLFPEGFSYVRDGMERHATWYLWIIKQAWHQDCNFEDLADGFGAGNGTNGGDWSGIRDSSTRAKTAMLERALNHLFGHAV